jgi:dTDP-glucose pyrophosphorylase
MLEKGGKAIVFVADEQEVVIGALTDGDVRRAIIGGAALDSRCLRDAMVRNFVSVTRDMGRAEVLELMRARAVEQIPVLDAQGRLCGLHTMQELFAPLERTNVAVILAGGRGTRLYPLTESVPKPMLTVAGRPILERLVLHLMSHGFNRIYIAVNYLADVIIEYFGDGSRLGCSIQYLREKEPLGTAGALSLLPGSISETALVINGDLVTQCDLGRLLEYHERGGFVATLGLRPHSITIPYGVAHVEDGKLVELKEKPTERMLINAGVYAISPRAVAMIPRGVEYPMTALLTRCHADGLSVGAQVIEDDWMDVGHHAELQLARGQV